MRDKRGFTLVELMIAAAIMSIIGLVIVSTFAGGLNVYYRMRSYSTVKADVLLALEKMERDIRNTSAFTGIDFIGTSRSITFPALIRSYGAAGAPRMSVGSVSYFIDDRLNKRELAREEKDYSASSMREEGAKRAVVGIAAIEEINFEYYTYDPLSNSYSWKASWDLREEREKKEREGEENPPKKSTLLKDRPEEIPLGVRVKLGYNDGGKKFMLSRAIFIEPAVSLNLAKAGAAEKADKLKEKSDAR